MANVIAEIKLTGIDFTIDVVKRIMNESDFENVTADYRQGFFDFGNALVKTLERLEIDNE